LGQPVVVAEVEVLVVASKVDVVIDHIDDKRKEYQFDSLKVENNQDKKQKMKMYSVEY
jgi:hypothetical protein